MMGVKPEGKFTPITPHYGITFQLYFPSMPKLYIVWFHNNGTPKRAVTGRNSKVNAKHECSYLEKLNYSTVKGERK